MSARDRRRYNNEDRMPTIFATAPKRLTRAPEPKSFRFQANDDNSRDLAICSFVGRVGNASSDQIVRHIIDTLGGSERGIRNRLRLLFDHGFLTRPKLQYVTLTTYNAPLCYGLGTRGARLLAEHGERINDKLDWSARGAQVPLQLEHTLGVAELILAFDTACRAHPGLQLVDQAALVDVMPDAARSAANPFACVVPVKLADKREALDLTIIPDRLLCVLYPNNTRHAYALELDRGTMPVGDKKSKLLGRSTFRKKLLAYYHLWNQDLHDHRWGFKGGFRVLTVTTSEARIRSMLEAQREITTVSQLFLYSTPQRLTKHGAFGPAWITSTTDAVSLLPTIKE
jgi:protein involved in plasmid replication-relaxation